ncbi:unnamed protein product [Lathyrus sativus]|nr:unnamed protein product [Lathyrus sativus]
MKKHIKEFFSAKFQQQEVKIPNLDVTGLVCLTEAESSSLEIMFDEEEIRDVIFECAGNKSPGLANFNLEFLKRRWSVVGVDVVSCIQEFHKLAWLPKATTSSFFA